MKSTTSLEASSIDASFYDKLIKTLKSLKKLNNEDYFKALNFIATLMLEENNNDLKTAQLIRAFNYDRLIIKVLFNKYDKHR